MTSYNSGKNHPKFIDLTNKKIGSLTCLDYVLKKETKYNRWVWECRCDCGEITFVRTTRLTNKNKPQIACKICTDLRTSKNKVLPEYQAIKNTLYNQYKRGASLRGYDFNLTKNIFESLIFKNCYYCNKEPEEYSSDKQKISVSIKEPFKRNGIDRLNNSLGYSIENCVSCCSICNKLKMNLDEKDFLLKIKEIYEFHKDMFENGSTTIEKVL